MRVQTWVLKLVAMHAMLWCFACAENAPGDPLSGSQTTFKIAPAPEGLNSEYGACVLDYGDAEPEMSCATSVRLWRPGIQTPDSASEHISAPEAVPASEHLISLASARGGAPIRFALQLADTVNPADIVIASPASRNHLLTSQVEAIETAQKDAVNQLSEYGASVVARQYLSNGLIIDAPGDRVEAILDLPWVIGASPAESTVIEGAPYDGIDHRNGSLSYTLSNAGYDGNSGGRAGGAIRVGIIEPQDFNSNHVGWRDTPGGPSRIIKKFACTDSGCTQQLPPFPIISNGHGSVVTHIVGGSIAEGQDSNFPGTSTIAQRRRSGVAPEVEFYVFRASTGCAVTHALWHAVAQGVDIVNLSVGINCGGGFICNRLYNCCNLNAQIDVARAYGVVVNACGGNDGGPGCEIWYPATRSETIAVSSLDANNATIEYDDLLIGSNQSPGPLPIKRWWGGPITTTAGIDFATAGSHNYSFLNTQDYASVGGPACSWATPHLTGQAALLRDTFSDLGWVGIDDGAARPDARGPIEDEKRSGRVTL